MSEYRKKPVVIEAFQMTRERRRDNRDWPAWLNEAWGKSFDEIGAVSCEDYPNSVSLTDRLVIRTLEGVMTVGWDDWIIRGVKGELYACKPDIFAATYEPASAPTPPAEVTVDSLMQMAQEYASAWSLVGGPFELDGGAGESGEVGR